ncbi:hypothetical protein SAMN06264364_11328 [Quadrisphaera granulorum]|uniref:Uncharacterized protein n=1 Tax=Quadrisphaera granulorum TaxID=317664 RepID=A0A316A8G5_9ACTN|nr:hypothetical protein BXY45_11328 [Quadrisphaera granulorum]SZE96944.1 hypothetical protein SAMN06264364_11328 [Quadrisphaera granulorum]
MLVDEFLAPLPWRRPKTGLLTPLVELLLDDDVEFWDVRFDPDPRVYASLFVVFTPERVITHRIEHARGDRRASTRTEVALRSELLEVASAMEPETPYSWLEMLCDWLTDGWRPAGRILERTCAWFAQHSAWFERTLFSLEDIVAPSSRYVDLTYQRFSEPITLPMSWDDVSHQRNRRFDLFYPVLLRDLP